MKKRNPPHMHHIWPAMAHGLVAVAVVTLAAFAFGQARQRQSSVGYIQTLRSQLDQAKPEVILLGDSMLGEGVDQNGFSNLTDASTAKISPGGSATAYWYLMLKNVIAGANHKPALLVIFFRDHFLTEPSFRVHTPYQQSIDGLALDNEPLLDRLAYWPTLNPLERFLQSNVRMYQERDVIKTTLERWAKSAIALLLGHETSASDEAIDRVFSEENMVPEWMNQRQLEAEQAQSVSVYDFQKRLPLSFLPTMVDIAKRSNIQLAFVRVKRRRDLEPGQQPAALVKYMKDLQAYFEENDVPLIDFTDDARIQPEHYGSGDHLNRDLGRPLFTRMVSEALAPYVP